MTEREKFEKWLNTLDKQTLVTMAAKQAQTIEELQAATKAAVPNVIFQLSSDAKDSLCAMLEYCLENGIGMGMDEGIRDFDSGDKYSFRLEIEALCDSLAVAPEVKDGR